MKPMTSFFILFLSSLSFVYIARAQGRSPHGLVNENPVVFSPLAFDFFHPNSPSPNADTPCVESDCAPLPLTTYSSAASAVAESTLAHASRVSTTSTSGSRVGVGGIVGIVFGFVFAALIAMGVYYVVITRQSNKTRANSIQPDA